MRDEPAALNEGEIHDVLRNDRRRAVIEFLSEHDGHATIRELSERIAAVESGEDPPPRNVRQSVYVSLHQTHLPKLEGLGIVAYDTDSKDVELREQATRVRAYMGQIDDETAIPVAKLCLAGGLFGVVLALAATFANESILGIDFAPIALVLFAVLAVIGGVGSWQRG
ncbi:MAG: hypothetical protein QXG03_10925 [Halalkalicoccus sp.]